MSDMVKLPDAATVQQVLIGGDLSKLTPDQRTNYYLKVCDSVGLNPLTQPFNYLNLNGKLQLYARKDATDQLRSIHKVSIVKVERENIEGVYVVTAYARDGSGREDVSTGAVTITGLKGDALANAMMKAETKAKRRVTLSICGLGILDETEVETIQNAQVIPAEVTPPAKLNGEMPPEEWSKKLVNRIRERESDLIKASKCFPGQLLEVIEQAWADAGLPDQPSKWNQNQRAVGNGLVKSIIAEFEAKQAPAENLDADPVEIDADELAAAFGK